MKKGVVELKPDGYTRNLGQEAGSEIVTKITSLIEMNDSILWLGTDRNGLYEYRFATDCFKKIETPDNSLVIAITSLYK